jgi:hypothetical protein
MRTLLAALFSVALTVVAAAQGLLGDIAPAPTGFPTPSFTNTNLTSWIQTSSANNCVKDLFNSTTWTACEDLSGFGNNWCQESKPAQPAVSNGGLYFNANGLYMNVPCFFAGNATTDLLLGGTVFTIGATFEIDSVLGANQFIIAIQNPGATANRIAIYVNTAGNLTTLVGTGAGSTFTGGAVSTGTKHTAILAGDLNSGSATLYLDGVNQGGPTFTATTLGLPAEMDLGNSGLPVATPYLLQLNGYLTCVTVQAANQSGGAITSLQTYHSGGSC